MAKDFTAMHKAKVKNTHDRVDAAIRALNKANKPINFHSVSIESGLSKTTLYSNTDIKARIMALRGDNPKSIANAKLSDSGKDAIIESLKRKNQRLVEENKDLRKQLELAYENYYSKA